jgi:ubiquinone/menaquinone biosynthesis C-methylase UbiE
VGVDLSAGQAVVFYNEGWTMTGKRQCLARVYRVGQENEIESVTITAKDTIETGIGEYIRLKEEIINKLLHGVPISDDEKELIIGGERLDEGVSGVGKDNISGGVARYLSGDYNVLSRMFSGNREIGERKFLEFIREHGKEYAERYKNSKDYSYQANSNRIVGTIIGQMIKAREQVADEIKIVDLASGPKMLQHHISDELMPAVRSLDLNDHHFTKESEDVDVASLTKLPYEKESVDYLNLSFALHYTAYNPSQEEWERLEVFREMARVLKVGGVATINLVHSRPLKHRGAFEQVMGELGLKVRRDWSGQVSSSGPRGRDSFISELVVLEKVSKEQDELLEEEEVSEEREELLEEVVENLSQLELAEGASESGAKKVLDGLKFRPVKNKQLRDQRQIISQFNIHTFAGEEINEIKVDYNGRGGWLKDEQDQALKVATGLLKEAGGRVENINVEKLLEAEMIRYELNGKWHLLKRVENGGEEIGLELV